MGHNPVPLNKKGIDQAKACGTYLKMNFQTISSVYSSTLLWAKQTAEIVCSCLNFENNINYIENLTERSFGEYSGLTYQEISRIFTKPDGSKDLTHRPINGESYLDFYKRTREGIEIILKKEWKKDDVVVIISHGGSIKHILGYLLLDRKNEYNSFPVEVENCSITAFDVEKNLEISVKFINFYQYLPSK